MHDPVHPYTIDAFTGVDAGKGKYRTRTLDRRAVTRRSGCLIRGTHPSRRGYNALKQAL